MSRLALMAIVNGGLMTSNSLMMMMKNVSPQNQLPLHLAIAEGVGRGRTRNATAAAVMYIFWTVLPVRILQTSEKRRRK